MSVRWLIATALVGLAFGLTWAISANVYEMGSATSLEVAAVTAAAIGIPMSWWSFKGQLLDEPPEVAWVSWRRVPAAPEVSLPRTVDEAALEAAFRAYQGKGSPVVVLTGPSGVGKTQLAASYARARMSEGWPLVAWVNSGSHEELLAGLLEFADAMSLRVPEEGSARAVDRLRQRPPTGAQPSVIIFDGVIDVEAVRPYLPTVPGWQVIVTSSSADAASLGIELPITRAPAADLAAQTGLAEATCAQLGQLAAAVDVAAATVREQNLDQENYVKQLDALPARELLGDGRDGARLDEDYPKAAAETVLLALAGAGFETDPLVRRLLGLLAVLSPGGVSRPLLYQAADPRDVDDTMLRLARWSLVSTRMDHDGLLLHELTRQVIIDRLRADDSLPRVIADAAELLGESTFGEDQAWARRGEGDLLIAHIAALSMAAGSVSASLALPTAQRVLGLRQWATRQLNAVGDGGRAVDLAESIRAECETLLGPDHPDSLAAADNLVIAYVAAGRAEEGVPLAEDVLDARKQVLGFDHPDTLASRYTVAYALEYAGQLDEAASRYDRAYTEYARVYGPDNPQTLTVASALARVRALQPTVRGRHRYGQRPTTLT